MINILLGIDIIIKIWNDNADFTFITALMWGLFLCVCGLAICFVVHYLQREWIIEYGWQNKESAVKKRFRKSRIIDRILLFQLYKSPKKGAFMIMCLAINLLSVLASIFVIVGFVGCCITRGSGWSMTLLLFTGWELMFISVIIESIPALICLRSERNRYK